jgi:transcriptional regulator with XRE-family HTH domain
MALDAQRLGASIAEIRKARGLTQQDLARKTGLTGNYLSLVENGQRTLSVDAINTMAQALDIPAECLTFLGSRSIPAEKAGRGFAELTELTRKAIRAAAGLDAR